MCQSLVRIRTRGFGITNGLQGIGHLSPGWVAFATGGYLATGERALT